MKVIIQDLPEQDFAALCPPDLLKNSRIIADEDNAIRHCVGCFGCWVKTPCTCLIHDGYGNLGQHYANCDELVIVTEVRYGCYSPFIKNVLDRNIGYLLPFFTLRKNEMHHADRYPERLKITVVGYAAEITPGEEATFRRLVAANALNLNAEGHRVILVRQTTEITQVLEALA